MKQVSMYVNGHTLKTNPGYAGSGIVLECEGQTKEAQVAIGHHTNHRAELEAVIFGLAMLRSSCNVTVYSCNTWLIKCANGIWGRNKPEYDALWVELDEGCKGHTVTFEWKKKGSHELLDRASALANEAANESAVAAQQE